jgi:hypothetical protein
MIYVVATSQVKPESRDAFIKGAKEWIAAIEIISDGKVERL